ncbi:hypothetical protein SEUCBS140593_009224 [Sporothrix eucalyptigena]|uniref:NAD-dependent epimerase/dehydratase domain-containing protein n=1 Tax=Sporothrix eucalyptigena TaxID=1812306 RepID=A0ABP0CUH8_9PEZI
MPSSLVLVTGASGFVGAEAVVQALKKYRARLTIRRPEQEDELRARFAETGHAEKLDFAVVPEIDNKEALKSTLEDVDYILHIASPMPATNGDIHQDYIDPAVRGTMAIPEVAEHVASIKRVVITSSYFSLAPLDVADRPGFATEEGANPSVVVDLDAPYPPAPYTDVYKYQISKVLAHRRALEWVAEHKPNFDVITTHPYYILGFVRALQRDADGKAQPRPVPLFYLLSLQSETPVLPSSFVDVRDLVAIELAALTATKLKPRGEITEVLAKGPSVTWAQIRENVKANHPDFPLKQTGDGQYTVPLTSNTDRATKDFGVVFHDPLETLSMTINQQGPKGL